MSSKLLHHLFFLCFTAILFISCSNNLTEPEPLIDEDTYTTLLVELELQRTYAQSGQIDSLKADSIRAHVFEHYGVTAEAFRKSHNYYQHFPKEQKKRIEEAIERLSEDRVKPKNAHRQPDSSS